MSYIGLAFPLSLEISLSLPKRIHALFRTDSKDMRYIVTAIAGLVMTI